MYRDLQDILKLTVFLIAGWRLVDLKQSKAPNLAPAYDKSRPWPFALVYRQRTVLFSSGMFNWHSIDIKISNIPTNVITKKS